MQCKRREGRTGNGEEHGVAKLSKVILLHGGYGAADRRCLFGSVTVVALISDGLSFGAAVGVQKRSRGLGIGDEPITQENSPAGASYDGVHHRHHQGSI